MSYELLDSVLQENGYDTTYSNTGSYDNSRDGDIYAGLDSIIEEAMKASLRDAIFISESADSTKLEHLAVVEDATFNESQYYNFIHNTIEPIIAISEGAITTGSDVGKIAVSLPVFEVAHDIWYHKKGGKNLVETDYYEDDYENEYSDDDSLYESVLGKYHRHSGNAYKNYGMTLEESMDEIFDRYDIEYDERDFVIREATETLNRYGMGKIKPDTEEVADLVMTYNRLYEQGLIYEPITDIVVEGANVEGSDVIAAVEDLTKLQDKLKNAKTPEEKSAIEKDIARQKMKVNRLRGESDRERGVQAGEMDPKKQQQKRDNAEDTARKTVRSTLRNMSDKDVDTASANAPSSREDKFRKSGKNPDKKGILSKVGGAIKSVGGKIGAAAKSASKFVGDHKKVAGAGAVITAGAIATYLVMKYKKRYAACKGKSGEEMAKCKSNVCKQVANDAKAKMGECANSKNPDKCKASAQKEYDKWMAKAAKFSK